MNEVPHKCQYCMHYEQTGLTNYFRCTIKEDDVEVQQTYQGEWDEDIDRVDPDDTCAKWEGSLDDR
ncbi:MAG: hypothetical protein HFJ75_08815 [Eggerthellaceae bacterium]|nr:hypothetical protein [Eggerthellaceae bacterium]